MIEKLNKNAKVEKFTNMLGIAVRLIVIDPSIKIATLHGMVCQNNMVSDSDILLMPCEEVWIFVCYPCKYLHTLYIL